MATKACPVKAMVFPVVMYVCESWTIKTAECWRIDAFELWCRRRFLRVPWTARRSNQYILKEISPEYSLEGLMLKLKLQYFGHLMQTDDSLEKTLMLGKIEGRRRKGRQRMGWLDVITDSMDMNLSKLQELPGMLQSMGLHQTWLSSWTELKPPPYEPSSCKLSKTQMWDFLVAQWIRICLPMQDHSFSPWSGRISCSTNQLSLCPTTTEPKL